MLLHFPAPASFTGEDVIELQGHGGSVAPRRVLEACLAAGARLAQRGEFTLRAFLNGRLDLSEAEAVIDLVDARTTRAAADAFARLGGALSRPFERLYADAIDLSSRLEHALDFDEGELPPSFAEETVAQLAVLRQRTERLIATAREGRLLREGALVVLAGAPNAGRSFPKLTDATASTPSGPSARAFTPWVLASRPTASGFPFIRGGAEARARA